MRKESFIWRFIHLRQIYIGSYEVSLKIFELASRRKLRGVDYVRRRIELGKDAYGKGSIGYELVATLCATLGEFTKIMEEYRVDAYEAYAGAVLRDAGNELFILDQIKLRTGLTVHVLSNSEHRFVSYKSVAMREEFEEMIKTSAAVVDVGGAGLQITLFSKGEDINDAASWDRGDADASAACQKERQSRAV